jgi:hypothetical protein
MLRLACFLLSIPLALSAQERLTGNDFDAFTRGQTFYYGYDLEAYGAEEYLDDRRVRWSFLDGECKDGYWYDTPENLICFVYEDRPDAPQCWAFFNDSEALRAQFARAGLRFDVPKPAEPASVQIAAPGSDPAKPPRLR